MTVEKFIRILGYIVYSILWSPVIVLGLVILPIGYVIMYKSVVRGLRVYASALKANIKHDMVFINTGVWH